MPARSALAIAILLAFITPARADKVDWSPYLEKPGATYAYKSTKPVADSAPSTQPTKSKAKKKAKPRAGSKARRKGR